MTDHIKQIRTALDGMYPREDIDIADVRALVDAHERLVNAVEEALVVFDGPDSACSLDILKAIGILHAALVANVFGVAP